MYSLGEHISMPVTNITPSKTVKNVVITTEMLNILLLSLSGKDLITD
ncbi:unnamed protein product [marine sediment metagenome]|uniref:Uncharacterized protein n=1 Tax=marine sediment metagenome TaxID=412755 RepID=X1AHT5_9ZZZZ